MRALKKNVLSLLLVTALSISALSIGFVCDRSVTVHAEDQKAWDDEYEKVNIPWLRQFIIGLDEDGRIGSSTTELGLDCKGIVNYIAENNISELTPTTESEKSSFGIGMHTITVGTASGPPVHRQNDIFTWKISSYRLIPGETITFFIKQYGSNVMYYYETTVYSEYDLGTLTIDLSEGSYNVTDDIERYTINHAIIINSLLRRKYDSNILYCDLDMKDDGPSYDLKSTITSGETVRSFLLEKMPKCSVQDEITITTPTDKMSLDQYYYGSVKFIFTKKVPPIPDPIDDNKDKPAQTQPVVNEEAPAAQNTAPAEVLNKSLKTTKFEKITATKKSVTLTWKKQTKKTSGYQIEYSTNKNFKDSQLITINKAKTTAKTIKKLKSGKKYYFRIRTIKKTTSGISYSKWSSKKSIKTSKK